MRFSVIVTTFMLVFSASAFSADVMQLDINKGSFQEQRSAIMKAINTDKDYAEISNNDRAELTAAFDRLAQKLDQNPATALPEAEREPLIRDQGVVNKALVQAKKDSRLICRKEPVLGSNFDKRICRTAASLKRENDKVRDERTVGSKQL